MKSKITYLLSFLLIGFLFSCESMEPNLLNDELLTIAEDEIGSIKSGEITDEDAQASIFGCGREGFGQRMGEGGFNEDCVTITSSGDDYPKEIVIDYGEGCEGRKGQLRTGKIIITMSGDILVEGSVYEMRSEDLMIGDRQLEMSKRRENAGQNAEGNWIITSTEEKTMTYEDGTSSSRVSSYTNEWLSGFGTEDRDDDVLLRTGSGTVETSEGDQYSKEITTALLIDRSCDYIKSGVIEMNKAGSEVIIDFGDGECDQWATVTTDGVEEEIDLSEIGGKGKRGFRGKGIGHGKGKGHGKFGGK